MILWGVGGVWGREPCAVRRASRGWGVAFTYFLDVIVKDENSNLYSGIAMYVTGQYAQYTHVQPP